MFAYIYRYFVYALTTTLRGTFHLIDGSPKH